MNTMAESLPNGAAAGAAEAQPPGGFASASALGLPARPAAGEAHGRPSAFDIRSGEPPRAETAFLESLPFDEPDAEDVTPLVTAELADCAWPTSWGMGADNAKGDVVAFQQAMAPARSGASLQLDTLAGNLADRIDAERTAPLEECVFDLEIPGHGRLEGRMSLRHGSVELELRAARTALGGVLRTRRQELEQLVDRESGGDVRLFIL